MMLESNVMVQLPRGAGAGGAAGCAELCYSVTLLAAGPFRGREHNAKSSRDPSLFYGNQTEPVFSSDCIGCRALAHVAFEFVSGLASCMKTGIRGEAGS